MLAHGENIANPVTGGSQPLPYQKPLRTWASRGTGATCDLCNARIHPHDPWLPAIRGVQALVISTAGPGNLDRNSEAEQTR